MYKVGVFPGKFLPPHRGHLHAIINSATKCEKLYVAVSHNEKEVVDLCREANCKYMPLKLRAKWLSKELQDFPHIKVILLDESSIPVFPNGWREWSELLISTIPEKFDVIFGGELSYKEGHSKYFPNVIYDVFDYDRTRFPISATEIRKNPMKYWNYILGSAREFFAKKILITGTESCGKSTMTKYLAKIYYTSWAPEEGRYYSERYLGGNEDIFTIQDFENIIQEQYKSDIDALSKANKVVFFDTDAVVTEYYAQQYIKETSENIKNFINPSRYDYVLFFYPDVKWVDDGQRFLGDQELRWKLNDKLLSMYYEYNYKNIIIIQGDYNQRLISCVNLIDSII